MSRSSVLCLALTTAVTLLVIAPSTANAAPLTLQFDDTSCHEPTSALNISASHIPDEIIADLAIELDGVDVTAVSSLSSMGATVNLVEALSQEPHTLRIYHDDAGRLREIATWQFAACVSEPEQNTTFTSNWDGEITANQLLRDSAPLLHAERHLTSSGASNFSFNLDNSTYSASLTGNLLHDSRQNYLPENKRLDLGQYLLSFGHGTALQLQLGHHEIDHSSLVLEQFFRPGVSISVNADALSSRVQAFSFNSIEEPGFSDPVGLKRSNQVLGISWDFWPLPEHTEALSLTAAYIDGKRESDDGDPEFASSDHNKATSLSATSALLNQQLALNAEYAAADTRSIEYGAALADRDGEALRAGFEYQHATDSGLNWSIGGKAVRVDREFFSITNEFLGNDREAGEIYGRLSWKALSTDLRASRERDNLDNLLDTTRTSDNAAVTINYASQSSLKWLGTSNYSIGVERQTRERDASAILFGNEADVVANRLNLQGNHALGGFSWFWRLGYIDVEDHAGTEPESETTSINIGSSFNPAAWLAVSLSAGSNRTSYDMGGVNHFMNYALQLRPTVPRLSNAYLNLEYADNSNTSFGAAIDQQRTAAGLGFSTFLLQPEGIRPGIALSLTGSYVHNKSIMQSRDEGLQFFLRLELRGQADNGGLY